MEVGGGGIESTPKGGRRPRVIWSEGEVEGGIGPGRTRPGSYGGGRGRPISSPFRFLKTGFSAVPESVIRPWS